MRKLIKRKRKGWKDERKQTLDMKIYPVVSIGTRLPLVHVVEARTKSIASWPPSLFRDFLDSPPRLSHQNSRQVPGHLDAISTKEFLHERRGCPCFPHKAVVAAPHQVGGSITCQWATKTPRGWHTKIQLVVHSRISTQSNDALLSHSL
jgi:hypothetical protein